MDNPYSIVAEQETTNEDIPYVIVYNPELTYQDINRKQLETKIEKNKLVTKNKPTYTGIERILVDIIGPIIIYAGTYIICDMFNTISTGNWTSLTRMFTGLWDYRHNFISDFQEFILNTLQELAGNTVDCDKKRNYGYDYCDVRYDTIWQDILGVFMPWKPDTPDVAACKAKVDENYTDCYNRTDEGQCSATATDYFNQCMIDTSTKTAPPPPPGVITTENWNHTYWTEECYRSSYTGYTNCLSGVDGYNYNDTWPTDY